MCAQGLIDSLYSQWNVPTILQSLGCIAQCAVSTFETRVEDITSYIWQNIIQVIEFNHQQSCLLNLFSQTMLISLGRIVHRISYMFDQVECLDDYDDLTSLHDTSQCSKSCKLKVSMRSLIEHLNSILI